MDYTFDGGTLANAADWGFQNYYFDSKIVPTSWFGAERQVLPEKPATCVDSAFNTLTRVSPVQFAAYGECYAFAAPAAMRNTVLFHMATYYTAPEAPVLFAVGLGGHETGMEIGAMCHRLHVDLSKPAVLFHRMPIGVSTGAYWRVGWRNEFASQRVYTQAAWQESGTQRLALTHSVKVTLPDHMPQGPQPFRVAMAPASTATEATWAPVASGVAFPYTRYEIR